MIGFWLVNLLIPGDPDALTISTSSGEWQFEKCANFHQSKEAMNSGQCAHTYSIKNNTSMANGAAACDRCIEIMTPILIGASYLSGLSITANQSLPLSDITIIQSSNRWPRERAIGIGNFCVNNKDEYSIRLERFITAWPSIGLSEKILLLIHHWLDALACWSFEDFYLSATTLLQIIAATEKQIHGEAELPYFQSIQSASARAGINPLNRDFKDMRNNLIHEGKLLGNRFIGSDIETCALVASDLMNWFDEYIHSVLNLGSVQQRRYTYLDFIGLNAYSI